MPFKSSLERMLGNSSVYGTPLTPMEYRLFLEVRVFLGLFAVLLIHIE